MSFMRPFSAAIFVCIGVLFGLAQPAKATSHFADKLNDNQSDSIRILWIGNSFTYFNDVPRMVEELGKLNGVPISTSRILKGGESLA